MKKFFPGLLALALALSACGPSKFTMDVELRGSSKSGIDLEYKDVSVSYVAGEDSLFLNYVAQGFAEALEKDYYGGEMTIGVYKLDGYNGMSRPSNKKMVDLVVDTHSDLAFLFDVDKEGITAADPDNSEYPARGGREFEVRVYVYDGMDAADTVRMYRGKSSLVKDKKIEDQGLSVGQRSAGIFQRGWHNARFVFYFYDNEKWLDAAYRADNYQFKEAMDIWLSLVDTKNLNKRSAAAYNIAAACYIMGQKELAKEWLDRSDADFRLPESASLHEKLEDQ